MQESSNSSQPVDLDQFLENHEFTGRPTVYFSPFEGVGDGMGVHRFKIQLMKEGVITNLKLTKQKKSIKVYELVVKVLEDCRSTEVNQSSQDKRYRFDANEEVMTTIKSAKKRGVDVYAIPLELVAKKSRKGKGVITSIDCTFISDQPPKQKTVVPEKPVSEDDMDFSGLDEKGDPL